MTVCDDGASPQGGAHERKSDIMDTMTFCWGCDEMTVANYSESDDSYICPMCDATVELP